MFSPVFGKVGLATLQPITSPTATMALRDNSPGTAALRHLRRLVAAAAPAQVRMQVSSQRPLIGATDAFQDEARPLGGLGIWLYDPETEEMWYAAASAPAWLLALLRRLQRKQTYIAQYELFAELCLYATCGDMIRGRALHHFVDNKSAVAGSISGYSSKPDSARVLDMLTTRIMRLACQPWFGFVYSEDNISDGPSRGDFKLMGWLGARRLTLVRPSLGAVISGIEGTTPGWAE